MNTVLSWVGWCEGMKETGRAADHLTPIMNTMVDRLSDKERRVVYQAIKGNPVKGYLVTTGKVIELGN